MKRKTYPSDRRPRPRPEIGSIHVNPETAAAITATAAAAKCSRREHCDRVITRILDELGAVERPVFIPITAQLAGAVWKRARRAQRSRGAVFEDALVQALDKAGAP